MNRNYKPTNNNFSLIRAFVSPGLTFTGQEAGLVGDFFLQDTLISRQQTNQKLASCGNGMVRCTNNTAGLTHGDFDQSFLLSVRKSG